MFQVGKTLDKIDNKLDRLDNKLQEQTVQLARNTDQLEIHIESHRTLKAHVDTQVQMIDQRIGPLEEARKKRVTLWKFFLGSLSVGGMLLGVAAGISKIFG